MTKYKRTAQHCANLSAAHKKRVAEGLGPDVSRLNTPEAKAKRYTEKRREKLRAAHIKRRDAGAVYETKQLRTPEAKAKRVKAFSKTMKGRPHSADHKSAISRKAAARVASGLAPSTKHLHTKETREKVVNALKNMSIETKEKRAKKVSKALKGRPQPIDGLTGKHAGNVHAKEWSFVNKAKGYALKGKNLNQLIRDNTHMFDEKDVDFDRYKDKCNCLASIGLRFISRVKFGEKLEKLQWKGWTTGD